MDDSLTTKQYNYAYLSLGGYLSLYAVCFISSMLSIGGSAAIIYLTLRKKKFVKSLYHRILFGLSCVDILYTLSFLLTPYLSRRDLGLPLAVGNIRSCEALGFFFQFFVGSALYSAGLAIFFLLTVRYGYKEDKASRVLEPWIHLVAFGAPIILGAVALPLGSFNPSLLQGFCVVSNFPTGCQGEKCERGIGTALGIANAVVAFLSSITGFICTWLVYITLRQREKQGRRFEFEGTTNDTLKRRLKTVTTQAILYSLAFSTGFVVSLLNVVVRAIYRGRLSAAKDISTNFVAIAAVFIINIFVPLQGLMNFPVFIRTDFIRWQKSVPNRSWMWIVWQILTLQPTPSTTSLRHLESSRIFRTSSRAVHGGDATEPSLSSDGRHVELATVAVGQNKQPGSLEQLEERKELESCSGIVNGEEISPCAKEGLDAQHDDDCTEPSRSSDTKQAVLATDAIDYDEEERELGNVGGSCKEEKGP